MHREFAVDFARRAGDIAKKYFKMGVDQEMKSDRSPVTAADLEINRLFIQEVKAHFPEHSIQGEEESHIIEDSEFRWLCDPIDGTRPFTHGVPVFTVSLALVRGGKSVLGVIYDPIMDRMFVGEDGKGAQLNGASIRVSTIGEMRNATGNLAGGRNSHFLLGNIDQLLIQREQCTLVRLGSVAYSTALVAAGEYEFAIFPYRSAHDIAAAKVIVEEAGGRVTDLFGDDQRYDGETKGGLITNGLVHESVLRTAQEAMKDSAR